MKVAIFCNTRTASKLVLNRLAVLLKLKSLSEPFTNFIDTSKPFDLDYCKNVRDQIYKRNNCIFKISSFNYKINFDSLDFIDYTKFDATVILNRKNLTDIVCSIYAGEYVRNENYEDDIIDCLDYTIPAQEVMYWYVAHQVKFMKVTNIIKKQNNFIEIFYEDLKNELAIRKQIELFFNVSIDYPLYTWRESNIKNRCLNYFEVDEALKKAQDSKSLNYFELKEIIYSSMGEKI
jgi:hypothetical protein